MATEIGFNEGKDRILAPGGGMPATSTFMLVTDKIAVDPANPVFGELYAGSVYADLTEVSWSGITPYARKAGATPAPVDGIIVYTLSLDWHTGSAFDGPDDVGTLILLDAENSKIIYGWDVGTIVGVTPVALNVTNANLQLDALGSFAFFLQNVGGN